MMTGFDVYRTYLALKQHFTKEGYDFTRYGGRTNAKASTFESRKDRYYFEKLSKQRDPTGYIIANLIDDVRIWPGELVSDAAERKYRDWLKRNQSLSYNFSQDLSKLEQSFDDNFRVSDGRHPEIIKLYLRKEICIETLIILMHLTGCYARWNKVMEHDPIWKNLSLKIRKYQPFMKYDLDKFKKITLDKFQS